MRSVEVISLSLPGAIANRTSKLPPASIEPLLQEAERLGVRPAVARNLLQDRDPESRAVAARNLWLREEQRRLISVLSSAGIRAHGVKGVALTQRLYPDLSWRQITDIDLLVSKENAARALEVLTSDGAVPQNTWNPSGLARQLKRSTALAPELVLITPGGLLVEVHWDWPEHQLPEDDLFRQPEAYLVYLCRHAGKHFWCLLKWCCDIALFLTAFERKLCWESFWRLARHSGAERHCTVSLELCRRWFGGPTLPGLESRLDGKALRLTDGAAGELLNAGAPRSHPVWTQFRLARWRDRPAILGELISPQPQDWNRAEAAQCSAGRVWLQRAKHLWRRWAPHRDPRLSARDWARLAEAYAVVALVELARRTLPARRLLQAAQSRVSNRQLSAHWTRTQLQRIAWLVDVAANRQPVAVRCLTRSVALAWMLRRRGVDAELRIGVREDRHAVDAHAWVEWRGETLWESFSQSAAYFPLPTVTVLD